MEVIDIEKVSGLKIASHFSDFRVADEVFNSGLKNATLSSVQEQKIQRKENNFK